MLFLHNNSLLDVNSWSKKPLDCSNCQQGEICKLSFASSHNKQSLPLKKINYDLWGLAPVTSVQKFCYHIAFINDSTRHSRFYTFYRNLNFISKTSWKSIFFKIKTLQSEGGGHYTWFYSSSLKLSHITLFVMSRNNRKKGVAERKHWHTVETGFTLMFHAYVPYYLFDAFATEVFLINWMPTPIL